MEIASSPAAPRNDSIRALCLRYDATEWGTVRHTPLHPPRHCPIIRHNRRLDYTNGLARQN